MSCYMFKSNCIVVVSTSVDIPWCGKYFIIHRLKLFDSGVRYSGLRLYNMLPDDLMKVPCIDKFKNKLKSYLAHQALYSVEEYLQLSIVYREYVICIIIWYFHLQCNVPVICATTQILTASLLLFVYQIKLNILLWLSLLKDEVIEASQIISTCREMVHR